MCLPGMDGKEEVCTKGMFGWISCSCSVWRVELKTFVEGFNHFGVPKVN